MSDSQIQPDGDRRSDEELMTAVATGDVTAFELLFARHKAPLMSFLARYLRDIEKAEDLFQQAFLKVFTNAASFAGRSSFRTWLYSIALNAARDLFRQEKLRRTASLDDPAGLGGSGADDAPTFQPPSTAPTPPDAAIGAEMRAAVHQALAQLEPEYREPFALARLSGMSYAEVADALDMTVGTVRMRVHRAHHRLAAVLGGVPAREGGSR
jgi:RNA polymerase sigma-70 factor (ECF subfamily)